jgi:hypothetical protein
MFSAVVAALGTREARGERTEKAVSKGNRTTC